MKIENRGNPIASQSKQNSQKSMKEFGLGFIPSQGSVKINYVAAKVDIDIKTNKPKIDVNINKPIMEYEPGKVDVSLKQRNVLNVDFEVIDIKA